jgi:hypothetical protein
VKVYNSIFRVVWSKTTVVDTAESSKADLGAVAAKVGFVRRADLGALCSERPLSAPCEWRCFLPNATIQ